MNDFTLTIKYTYTPPYHGYRNSLFVPEEPDEPEEVCICEIIDECGKAIDLSEKSLVRIEEHILNCITKL